MFYVLVWVMVTCKELCGPLETLYMLFWMTVTQMYTIAETHGTSDLLYYYKFLYLHKGKEREERILDNYYSKRTNWGGGEKKKKEKETGTLQCLELYREG